VYSLSESGNLTWSNKNYRSPLYLEANKLFKLAAFYSLVRVEAPTALTRNSVGGL
jgi:hypothetical protein